MKLVIFDLDGTLIDSVRHFVETVTVSFEAVGQPVPDEQTIRSVSGITAYDAMAMLAPGMERTRVEEILKSYREHYFARAGLQNEPLFDGVLTTLDRLRADPETIVSVATGKSHRGAIQLLERHGILDRFHSVETPDHNRGKPDPQMIQVAMVKAGIDRPQTVMIGDTVHDMRMAKSAGVGAIGVSWGYHDIGELHATGADVVIDRFDELDAAIARLVEPSHA
ncbi:HAD family hydrolase [Devosia sp.]|uniref:HAD family hydrolase n=1 Tax=Devosia sp. TaxID=1871048 RepID=UPI003A94C027